MSHLFKTKDICNKHAYDNTKLIGRSKNSTYMGWRNFRQKHWNNNSVDTYRQKIIRVI